jgi:quercetin 2,3-dioxygenase
MSGPVTEADVPPRGDGAAFPSSPEVDLIPSHSADVAGTPVRRALPHRGRRTVGAWCFLDHMGPMEVTPDQGMRVGPHPHIGLQTVTWLIAGEVVHTDSLGTEQVIRPGHLNLMTAGGGVAHAEESTSTFRGPARGVQLWVAQPERTRHGPAAFEHHGELPRAEFGSAVATVLVGSLGDATSPARRDTDHVGVDLDLHGGASVLPLQSGSEYAIVVLAGALTVSGRIVEPGVLAYLGRGRHELTMTAQAPARALLIGGVPLEEPLLMWWNFVGRTRDEMTLAYEQWQAADDRFGTVASALPRIPAPPPFWLRSR